MSFAGEYGRLLAEPDCRSGYEYARRQGELWQEETAEALRLMAGAYLNLYQRTGNLNSLGIALYLQELSAGRPEREGT